MTGIFGDLNPIIEQMKRNMPSFVEADETIIGYTVLNDGRKAQISIKLNTCEDEWIRD